MMCVFTNSRLCQADMGFFISPLKFSKALDTMLGSKSLHEKKETGRKMWNWWKPDHSQRCTVVGWEAKDTCCNKGDCD